MDAYEAVSAAGPLKVSGKKYFSPEEATRTLPLVRRIVVDIVRNYQQYRELHEACRASTSRPRSAEMDRIRQQYLAITDHLSDLKEELDRIGCELKDCQTGLLDFSGMLDGREVCLCWKLGEDSVAHWHELDTGYAGRQPIAESIFTI